MNDLRHLDSSLSKSSKSFTAFTKFIYFLDPNFERCTVLDPKNNSNALKKVVNDLLHLESSDPYIG